MNQAIARCRFWSALLMALGNVAARQLPWLMTAMAVLQMAFGALLIRMGIGLRQSSGSTEVQVMLLLALGALLSLTALLLALLMLAWIYRSTTELRQRGIARERSASEASVS
ncbi:hypothetical protein GALL_551160 [mine drainage metagenome]|uniref:Uncharacterized protein n=1 Tax=mine drainage metagenome TaxID=410659 RepID=A0A1J5NYN9_9ZZZZ